MRKLQKNLLLFLSLFFISVFSILLISCTTLAQSSPDVIAIRVIPNPEHLSPLRWYQQQNFQGSPQSLLVDGYQAVRNGRTVYVNAANISDNDEFFTNIYIISYNQEAEQSTLDIFGQILANWQFNSNVLEDPAIKPVCINPDKNQVSSGNYCRIDSDCLSGEYCNSKKSKVIRDTKRLSDFIEIKFALDSYHNNHNGRYPVLSAGTYLPNISISAWPSWNNNLARDIGLSSLPTDPINALGDCGDDRFNPITCWDEQNKEFADPDTGNDVFELPADSNVFVYESRENGQAYNICAVMESPYLSTMNTGNCTNPSIEYKVDKINHPPVITNINMPVTRCQSGDYSGYISAMDEDGDALTWELDFIESEWTSGNWPGGPTLGKNYDYGDHEIQTIYQGSIGAFGLYNFNVKVTDTSGGYAETEATVKIVDIGSDPLVINSLSNQTIVVGNNIDMEVGEIGLSYIVTGDTVPDLITPTSANPFFKGILTSEGHYTINVYAEDRCNHHSQTETFTLDVINHAPIITTQSLDNATACQAYNFQINANDIDGHTLTFAIDSSSTALPTGLTLDLDTGLISGTPTQKGSFDNIKVIVTDEYGASAEKTYSMSVNDAQFEVELYGADNSLSSNPLILYTDPNLANGNESYRFPKLLDYKFVTNPNTPSTYTIFNTTNPTPASSLDLSPDLKIQVEFDGNNGEYYLRGRSYDETHDPHSDTYTFTIQAEDSCQTKSTKEVELEVISNIWCGDSIWQSSKEACDSSAPLDPTATPPAYNGIAIAPEYSSIDRQYSCDENCQPTGGWCGDPFVQNDLTSTYDYVEDNEVCDGGTQACTTSLGYQNGEQTCKDTCDQWNTCTSDLFCGDEIKSGNEKCDYGDVDNDTDGTINTDTPCVPNQNIYDSSCQYCDSSCVLRTEKGPRCGDGIVQDGSGGTKNYNEICDKNTKQCTDDDNYKGVQHCDNNCTGWKNCQTTERCGDDIINGNEDCEKGYTKGTSGSNDFYICDGNCHWLLSSCGDARWDRGYEDCDASDPSNPNYAFGPSYSRETRQYDCNKNLNSPNKCTFQDDRDQEYGWCGDNDIQNGTNPSGDYNEECDCGSDEVCHVAVADSSTSNRYTCSDNCTFGDDDHYCGDGFLDSIYGESCDGVQGCGIHTHCDPNSDCQICVPDPGWEDCNSDGNYDCDTSQHECNNGSCCNIGFMNCDQFAPEDNICECDSSIGQCGTVNNINQCILEIETCEELQKIGDLQTGIYTIKLMNDIDCSATNPTTGGSIWGTEGFEPLNSSGNPNIIDFDGQNYTISKLYINRSDVSDVGLFAEFFGGSIQNLSLENISINGKSYVGGIVGIRRSWSRPDSEHATISPENSFRYNFKSSNYYHSLRNISVEGNIQGNGYDVGGIIGSGYTIEDSYFNGNVTNINGAGTGGFIGGSGSVINSESHGIITGNNYVGGLVGSYGNNIENSLSSASISGNDYVGGLVGKAEKISRSSSEGNVTGHNDVGGIAGSTEWYRNITNVSATGNVNGHDYVGGICGYSRSNTTNVSATGNVNGHDYVGGICGRLLVRSISGANYVGDITANNNVGGIVGDYYRRQHTTFWDDDFNHHNDYSYDQGDVYNSNIHDYIDKNHYSPETLDILEQYLYPDYFTRFSINNLESYTDAEYYALDQKYRDQLPNKIDELSCGRWLFGNKINFSYQSQNKTISARIKNSTSNININGNTCIGGILGKAEFRTRRTDYCSDYSNLLTTCDKSIGKYYQAIKRINLFDNNTNNSLPSDKGCVDGNSKIITASCDDQYGLHYMEFNERFNY